jgi:hypothetical protein
MWLELKDKLLILVNFRRRVALVGVGEKPPVPTEKPKKPGEGQMRWRNGSYLTSGQVTDERFQIENDIA